MKLMVKYNFKMAPTEVVRIAIVNSGQPYGSKSGVFAISLLDDNGLDVADKSNLFFSKKINKYYTYAITNKSGTFFDIPKIRTNIPFSGVSIEYFPIFTETPINSDHLGPLLYSVEPSTHNQGRLIQTVFPVKSKRS